MSLRPRYSITRGFYGDLVTDSDGQVTFAVPGWATYTVWIDHREFQDIGVGGDDESFSFEIEGEYKSSYGPSSFEDEDGEGDEGNNDDDEDDDGEGQESRQGTSDDESDDQSQENDGDDRGENYYDSGRSEPSPSDSASEHVAAARSERSERAAAELHGDSSSSASSYAGASSSGVPSGSASDLIGWGGCIGPIFGVISCLLVWAGTWIYMSWSHTPAEVEAFDSFAIGKAAGVTVALLFLGAAVWRVIKQERISGRTNHGAHLFLTLITVGFWLPVWISLYLFRGRIDRSNAVIGFSIMGVILCCVGGTAWMSYELKQPSRTSESQHTPQVARRTIGVVARCPDEQVFIPGGTVDGHVVGAFCIDRTEVTVAAYRTCASCSAPNTPDISPECNWGREGAEDHPVNCLNWDQAVAFCRSRGGRLPTEWEWQFAAQGTDGREYPWGNNAPSNQLCWSGVTQRGRTCAVGSFPSGRSPFGAEDMAGNVWEWTSAVDGTSSFCGGGSWGDTDPARVRASDRQPYPSWNRHWCLGFRCARGLASTVTPPAIPPTNGVPSEVIAQIRAQLQQQGTAQPDHPDACIIRMTRSFRLMHDGDTGRGARVAPGFVRVENTCERARHGLSRCYVEVLSAPTGGTVLDRGRAVVDLASGSPGATCEHHQPGFYPDGD